MHCINCFFILCKYAYKHINLRPLVLDLPDYTFLILHTNYYDPYQVLFKNCFHVV